ncbi:MAG: MATE family efflux transporter [Lachnospiraceae bacterium]|nr:MATE family efflux transporter [Lachnospiraceae bacterium]
MKKRKNFLYAVIGIAVPVGLQSMLQSSFAMIDQLMVGQLGSTAVTAVEVAGRPAFIYSVVLGAVSAIAGIMISQYLGMKDEDMADRSLYVNLLAAIALAVLFTVLCLLLPEQIVDIYIKDDPAVLSVGTDYLVRIVWTYLPMGISSILAVMIRCMDRAVCPLYAGITAAVVNTTLNYVLIFGHFGFPALGVTGAAIASVISQLVNLLLILIMFYRIRVRNRGGLHFSLTLGKDGYRQFLLMLLPILINEFLWSVGQNVNTFIYGHLEKGDLAAMSMTGPIQGLFIGALSGVSQAAGILIGKRLGAREYDQAYQESKKLLWYGLAGSLVLSFLLILLREPYVLLYKVEPEIRAVSGGLLMAFAILAPVKVANMILGGGIIRSGGKTTYIMVIDMIGTWLVGAPLGLITAFLFHLPVVWVYFILSQEELVRLLMSLIIFRRRKWMTSFSEPVTKL